MSSAKLAAYCNDELPLSDRLLLESEIINDDEAQLEIAEQEKMHSVLTIMHDDESVNQNILRAALISIEEPSKKTKRIPFPLKRILAIASCLAIIFTIFLLPQNKFDNLKIVYGKKDCNVFVNGEKKGSNDFIRFGDKVQVKKDKNVCFIWQDGTWLNLTGPANLQLIESNDRHELKLLNGTLTAKVTKQKKPMLIHSPHGTTKVIGTTLTLFVNKHRTTVSVKQGEVELIKDNKSIAINAGKTAMAEEHNLDFLGNYPADKILNSGATIWQDNFNAKKIKKAWQSKNIRFKQENNDSHIIITKDVLHPLSYPTEKNPLSFKWSENHTVNICCRVKENTILNLTLRSFEGEYNEDDKNLVTLLCTFPVTKGDWQTFSVPLSKFIMAKPAQKKFPESRKYWLENWQNKYCNAIISHCDPKTTIEVKRLWITE